MRSCGMVGGTVRIALSDRTAFAIAVQQPAECFASLCAAIVDQLGILLRQAEIVDGFAGQAKREIEAGYPRARLAPPIFECCPVGKLLQAVKPKGAAGPPAAGYGNRLLRARAAGEIDTVDGPRRFTHDECQDDSFFSSRRARTAISFAACW